MNQEHLLRGNLSALDHFSPLLSGEKVVDVQRLEDLLPNAVGPTQTLDDACGIPRDIIIHNSASTVEVDSLRKLVRGDQNAIVVPLLLGGYSSIKIGQQVVKEPLSQAPRGNQDPVGERRLQRRPNVPYGILVFTKDHHLSGWLSGTSRHTKNFAQSLHQAPALGVVVNEP